MFGSSLLETDVGHRNGRTQESEWSKKKACGVQAPRRATRGFFRRLLDLAEIVRVVDDWGANESRGGAS
jgi:hypothetical protein